MNLSNYYLTLAWIVTQIVAYDSWPGNRPAYRWGADRPALRAAAPPTSKSKIYSEEEEVYIILAAAGHQIEKEKKKKKTFKSSLI